MARLLGLRSPNVSSPSASCCPLALEPHWPYLFLPYGQTFRCISDFCLNLVACTGHAPSNMGPETCYKLIWVMQSCIFCAGRMVLSEIPWVTPPYSGPICYHSGATDPILNRAQKVFSTRWHCCSRNFSYPRELGFSLRPFSIKKHQEWFPSHSSLLVGGTSFWGRLEIYSYWPQIF